MSLRAKDYVWGSNGVPANYGMELLVANILAPDPSFMEGALDNLHYCSVECLLAFLGDTGGRQSLSSSTPSS